MAELDVANGTPLAVHAPDGTINGGRFAPPGTRRHPAVFMLMDAPGLRPALRAMAARLASHGYLVWLPNLYYRIGTEVAVGPTRHHPDEAANRATMMSYIATLSNERVVADVVRLADALAHDERWDGGPIGLTGYCMSGRFATLSALALGERAACAASYFGTRLVTDAPDSPHRVLAHSRAELYFAFAEHDPFVPPETIEALRASLQGTTVRFAIETYPGTEHGFVFEDRGSHHADGARRHWATLLALLARNLRQPA